MPTNSAPSPLSAADYEAIELAVMETARGRWFLAEYARRNRHADTEMLLAALERLENAFRNDTSVAAAERVRFGLIDMAGAIARTRAEIAAIKPDGHGRIEQATEELDSVVEATERATSDILAAAEQIQEIAWTLREQGHKAETCDFLDDQATDIYTACSFQDLTGQRTHKVIGVLRYLESRIAAMIEIWGLEPAEGAMAVSIPSQDSIDTLLNGPAKPGHGLDQADIDIVMGADADGMCAASAARIRQAEPAVQDSQLDDQVAAAASFLAPIDEAPVAPAAAAASAPALTCNDSLAPLRAMSYEERIALFS